MPQNMPHQGTFQQQNEEAHRQVGHSRGQMRLK